MASMVANKQAEPNINNWIRALQGWHGILMTLGIAGIGWVFFTSNTLSLLVQIILGILLGIGTIGSGIAIYWLGARQHNGRLLSITLNYLLFLGGLFSLLTQLNVFIGMDSLANTFGRGVPFLLVIFAGYLVSSYADRFEENPALQKPYQTAGKWIAVAGGIAFLFAIGLLQGLLAFATGLASVGAFASLLLTTLCGGALWMLWQRPFAETFGATNAHNEMLNGYLFLSPNLLGFLIFFAGPMLFSLYVSFTNWDAFGTAEWVGLQNYAEIFNLTFANLANADQLASEVIDTSLYTELTRLNLFGQHIIIGAQDRLFWIALGNTLKFVLLAVPLSVIPALVLSNLLNSKIPGMKFFRAVYFLPSVAAVVGIALVWQWLFNSTVGYINYAITLLTDLFNMTDPQVRWLSDSNTALLAVVIMSAWQWVGFNTVLFLAGLQNIPKVLYEAATVDGANTWDQFFRITLPLLAPTTFFVVITTTIQAMQVFEQVFILIPGTPAGPGNSTLTMVLYLYQKGFQRFEQGYASAIAWVLFILILGATLVQFRRQRDGGTSYDA